MSATLELKPIPTGAVKAEPAVVPVEESAVVKVVKNAIEKNADVTTLTRLYLKLRAGKEDLTLQAKTKLAPVNKGLDMIEAHFLNMMNEMKVDSLKNEAGTPYKSKKVSIGVADNDAWLDFVVTRALDGLKVSDAAKEGIKNLILSSGQLALIEARASKTAVEALMAEQEGTPLPPGLNRREEFTVNLRAA